MLVRKSEKGLRYSDFLFISSKHTHQTATRTLTFENASSEVNNLPAPKGPAAALGEGRRWMTHSDALAHLSLKEQGGVGVGEEEHPAQAGEEEEIVEALMFQKKARSWKLGGAAVL